MAPRPTLMDLLRTARVAGTDIASFAREMATRPPSAVHSTGTAEGLAAVQRRFGRALQRLGIAVEVRHAERVPAEGGLVLMWNQTTHLEHLLLPVVIPRPFLSLYNNEVARTPFYGAHLAAAGHLHLDRNDEAQWRASVARGAAQIRDGCCFLVSPEGTRSYDGKLLPMKRGAFILAVTSQRPIVCVTVIGGHDRMPRGSPIVRAGPLGVVFSEPIPTVGHRVDDMAALQAEVAATFERDGSL